MDSYLSYGGSAPQHAPEVSADNNPFRDVLMQAPAAIAVLEGRAHIYSFANLLYQKTFGRTEEELIGKTPREVLPEIEGQGVYELFDQVYETMEPYSSTELPITFRDGGNIRTGYFNVAIQPILKETGEISGLIMHISEVTAQTEARRSAEESEAQFRSLFAGIDQAFCIIEMLFDKDGNPADYLFLEVNPVFAAQTGLKDATGKTIRQLVPNLEERWFQIYGEVASTGTSVKFIEGSEVMGRWFEVNAFRLGGAASKKVALLFTDITEKRTAEKVLQENKQLLQTVFDASPNSLAVFDPVYNEDGEIRDFRILMVNEFTVRTTGRSDLPGRLYAETFPHVVPAGVLEKFLKVARTGEPEDFERWYEGEGLRHWFRFIVNRVGRLLVVTTEDITARKEAEDKLRESEQRFRSMADASPVMIWTLDEQGNSTYYNRKAAEFTGHSENELREGKSWQVAIHPDDIGFAAGVVSNAVMNRIPYEMECRMQNSEGEWRWLLNHGTPRFGNEGEYFGFVGSSVDITERKNAEAELRQSENRFRSIFETAAVSIWEEDFSLLYQAISELREKGVTDFAAYFNSHPEFVAHCLQLIKVKDVNEATLQMFEADSKSEMLGNLSAIFVPETMPVFAGELLAVAEGRTSYVSECRLRTLKGNSLYALFSVKLPAHGDPYDRVLFTLLDITERRAAEEKIRESETRFRLLAEAFPHLAWTASPDGKGMYFNRRWYEYTGLSTEEALLDDGSRVVHPEDFPRVAALWQEHLQTGEDAEIELRYLQASTGQFRWFLVKAVPVKSDRGEVLMWIGTCTDIHEQKMAMESLETLVEKRTKELQRSNEDLQQFAHVASHDLKEPVRKVKTFISRLEQHLADSLDETGTKYIERIQGATDRMSTMIEGVLRYSTMNASTEPFQPVNLDEVISHIETDLEVVIQKSGAQIRYGGLPVIDGAPVLMYQVFYNLINNSLKFSKPGVPPEIAIMSAGVLKKGRAFAEIVLSDNGIGFEEEHAANIFDTFTRLHSKDKYEGTGLGLALCRKIVERHGGSISAKGVPGEGAVFTILLPVKQ